jgi:hypothetical protein
MSDGPDFDAFVEWANRARGAQQAVNDLGAGPPHVPRETETPEDLLADMRDKFGDTETRQYMRLAKAIRSLMHIWTAYAQAPEGSFAEAAIADSLDRMLKEVAKRPEHAIGLIEGLLAIVQHLRQGGTYEDWFESIGISAEPGRDRAHD